MALIEWSDDYDLGIVSIDKQHQRLVGIINELYEAHVDGRGSEAVDGVLKKLIAYTVMHFGAEEKYLDKYEVPSREQHKKIHAEFVEKLRELRKQAEIQKSGMSTTLMRFLKTWLIDHIQKEDQKYREKLVAEGIS